MLGEVQAAPILPPTRNPGACLDRRLLELTPMVDVFSKSKRRAIMQSIRREGTKPECIVERLLAELDVPFSMHPKDLPGKPDFVFGDRLVVLFVHGCFWHGHDRCTKGIKRPKTRWGYWSAKIDGNRRRDKRVARKLRNLGYSVFVVWECDVRKGVLPARIVNRLSAPATHR